MRGVQIAINYKHYLKISILQVTIITATFILKLVLQIFNSTKTSLLFYGAFNIIDYINVVMVLQFIDILLLICQRFTALNKKLEHLILSNVYSIYINKRRNPMKPAACGQINSEMVITSLGKIYNELCLVSRLLNKTFNIQILLTITCRFIMLTAQMVSIYNIIKGAHNDAVQNALASVYCVLHAVVIFLLATVSQYTADEVSKNIKKYN